MDEPTEDSEPVRGQWNPVVVTVILLLLLPVAPLVLPAIFFYFMIAILCFTSSAPAHSASTRIADLRTELTLRYYPEYSSNNSGTYVYASTPGGRIRIHMPAYWAQYSRTSVYRTPERKIAILGGGGDDYFVSIDSTSTGSEPSASESWTYLGAFDHVLNPGGGTTFRFVDATEQPECIPMRSSGPYRNHTLRANARQEKCANLTSNDPRAR